MGNRFEIGDRVTWRAAGKISRLDGVRGKSVTGIVTGFILDVPAIGNKLVVLKDHDSIVPNAQVSFDAVIKVERG